MQSKFLWLAVLIAMHPRPSIAVTVASDSSFNNAYNAESGGAWKGLLSTAAENPIGNDNGGFGLLPWNFAGGFHDPAVSPYGRLNHFIDGVDFAHSSFNNLGARAFGLTNANIASFGFTARATRVFSQPLAVGGSVSIDFDNPVLAPLRNNDETGYLIRLNSGGGPKIASNPNVRERLGLFAMDGFQQQQWSRTDASGTTDTGIATAATTTGARLRVTLQAAESYLLEILPLTGGTPLYSVGGNLATPNGGSIDSIEILMFGNGSGNGLTGVSGQPTGQREFFFDRLIVENPLVSMPGDYNRDGVVDAADYVVWRKTDNTNPQGYDDFVRNFGNSQTGNGAVTVPEPATLTIMVVLAARGLSLRRSRQPQRPNLHNESESSTNTG